VSRLIRQSPSDAMPNGLATGEGSSASLPFLPTLATALVLAGASFLCREPAQDRPVPPVPGVETVMLIDPHAFPEPAAAPAEPRPSAALAFAQAYPLLPAEPRAVASRIAPRIATTPRVAVTPRIAPMPRIAAMPPRRPPCLDRGLDCEATPRRPEPVLASQPAEPKAAESLVSETRAPETIEAATEDDLLPDLALPFAPAARAAGRAADFVRTGAATLGGSVTVLVDRLR
jgi:hypothetical protein